MEKENLDDIGFCFPTDASIRYLLVPLQTMHNRTFNSNSLPIMFNSTDICYAHIELIFERYIITYNKYYTCDTVYRSSLF